MSPADSGARFSEAGFPRVSGDEPLYDAIDAANQAFSPRERG